MAPLRLHGVRKEYGPVVAVDGVSLTVEPGTFHCLVGPNGSGKTTMLRLLLGLVQPTDGRVERPDAALGPGFQRPTFYPDLSVADNLDVFGDLVDADPDWRETVVERLGLDRVAHREAAALSGGYAKKLDLALGLLGRPDYALLDEPLGDLDDVTRADVVDFLADARRDGRTVLVSTHRLGAFAEPMDRLTVVDRGTVRYDAGGDDLAAGLDGVDPVEFYLDLLADGASR